MVFFRRLWQHLTPPPPPPPPPARPNVQRVVERLSEDEALRGDLTDAGYGALFGAVVSLAEARGAQCASTDELYVATRALLAGAVAAAEGSDPVSVLGAATAPLITPEEQATLSAALAELSGPADEAAARIAQALKEAAHV
jgi:hypothetical protein